jgi:hypothetical protein
VYAIKEDQGELTEEIVQDVVHQSLECHRGVGQTERHDKKFELPMVHAEGCLGDVGVVHLDMMIAAA